MTGRRRLAVLALLVALPIVLAVLMKVLNTNDPQLHEEVVNGVLGGMLISVIMPIVVMALATAAFGNELEDRTLNVLVLKPIPRVTIVLAKLSGSIIVAAPLVVIAGIIITLVGIEGAGLRGVLAAMAALLAGVIAYATVFTWAGLITSKALGFALVYVVLWEGLLTSFLTGVRYLSIRWWTLGILHGADSNAFPNFGQNNIELVAAIVGVAVVTGGFFYLTVRRLQRMDVP
ncbi:MAG: ABC-2 type transport system permease protein [Chloroflexi bacterium]|jgi:ABC-2 type transport system permease protein|nr:MAG: ABC-2 type transport system permease protein [Chloroflexota bacterium]